MPFLTPDDLLKLQQCAIERLQSQYSVLQRCELHVTPEDHLAIECFDSERLTDVQGVLPRLEFSSWRTVGVSHILLTYHDHPICQVETRTKLEKTLRSALESEGSIKCNLMTSNATLEAPATTATPTAEIVQLVPEVEIVQILSESTGFSEARIREMMNEANAPRFEILGQVALAPQAGIQILRDWYLRTEQKLMGGAMKTMPDASPAIAEPTNGASRTRKTASSKSAPRSSGGALDGFKPNFSSYAKTAKDLLEALAPKNEKKQQQMAGAIAKQTASGAAHLKALVNLYQEKGKNPEQAAKKLLKEFEAIAKQPATEAAAEPTAS